MLDGESLKTVAHATTAAPPLLPLLHALSGSLYSSGGMLGLIDSMGKGHQSHRTLPKFSTNRSMSTSSPQLPGVRNAPTRGSTRAQKKEMYGKSI